MKHAQDAGRATTRKCRPGKVSAREFSLASARFYDARKIVNSPGGARQTLGSALVPSAGEGVPSS